MCLATYALGKKITLLAISAITVKLGQLFRVIGERLKFVLAPRAGSRFNFGRRPDGEGKIMKLLDLDPHWITFGYLPPEDAGKRLYIGIRFNCPHCLTQRLAVMFTPPIDDNVLWKYATWDHYADVISQEGKWNRTGETFETLTLKPSINTEFHGHWHGFIENGEIK